MKIKKPLLIVLGEPNSVFIEILSKVLNNILIKKKINFPIILIGSKDLISSQLKMLNMKLSLEILNGKNYNFNNLKNKVYIIDVVYKFKKPFEIITNKSKSYITKCFDIGLKYLNNRLCDILINGPISKKNFLNNNYPGITEYVFKKSNKKISKYPTMLIFNNKMSVSPITTHIPLKNVNKNIDQKIIIEKVTTIKNFYKSKLKINPKIAITGLNPHCETNSSFNEEKRIIKPAIKKLKKRKIKVSGPFSTDTFFIKKNINNYDCVVGMYHDQILTPFKTIFGFDATNITLGLPFVRMSVDHGPNYEMVGKNISSTKSLENIFNLINKIK